MPARAAAGLTLPPLATLSPMERGQIVLEHTIEGEEELWQEDGGDYDGWFCVRTDPFPCPASGCVSLPSS
jgi:hypothetical protein